MLRVVEGSQENNIRLWIRANRRSQRIKLYKSKKEKNRVMDIFLTFHNMIV